MSRSVNPLLQQMQGSKIVFAPGIYDALGATIAAEAGFQTLYLSGAGVSYTRLGRSDLGLLTMSEMADAIAQITDRTGLPLIADGDTGFGNALNMARTIRTYERAGAAAIQVEDQSFPKRCGHLQDKKLVSPGEMAGKIKAAVDTRDDMLIIARTDAIAVEGIDAAIERGELYVEAGADVLFIEAPRNVEEMTRIADVFSGRIPLFANMVEGGHTPILSAAELEAMGYSIVIFPGGLVRAVLAQMRAYFTSLRATGDNNAFAEHMLTFNQVNEALDISAMLAFGARYQPND